MGGVWADDVTRRPAAIRPDRPMSIPGYRALGFAMYSPARVGSVRRVYEIGDL